MRMVTLTVAVLAAMSIAQAVGAQEAVEKPLEGMKIALLTGEGFQDAEAMMPLAFLTNRGATVTVIGTETGEVGSSNGDVTLLIEKAVADVSPGDFDALVLPGGQAPEKIRANEVAVGFVRDFYASGKPVAAICHGPQLLISAGVVEGVTMTCYADVAEELQDAGANYQDQPVVRDKNLITSRNPDDIPAWLSAMEELFVEAKGAKV
jgi:protease I